MIRWFLFDVILANNNGMRASYSYGDALLVKKSFNSYNNGDVVYFEFPLKDTINTPIFFTRRICALPGDSFEVCNKEVYINGIKVPQEIVTIKHNYFIKTKQVKLDSLFKFKYNLTEGGEISDEFDYSYSLTFEESETLKKDSLIQSVEVKMEKPGLYDELCFPSNVNYPWNIDQYGKIYIPKKNDVLVLDTVNIDLYSNIIGDYENKKLEVRGDSIFIDSQLTNKYIVEQDYYFVLGDNRSNSIDSRMWGYLPESCIKGKVIGRIYKAKQ